LIIKLLKGWNSSNIGELLKRAKILFMKTLRANRSQGMLAIIRCRIFYLLGHHPKKNIEIYRTIIMPVPLLGRKTWTITLREKRRLRVFENRTMRNIFGPKRDEVTRKWRKLDNEELNVLYSSPNIVREILNGRGM
jgi:hypothetical protein